MWLVVYGVHIRAEYRTFFCWGGGGGGGGSEDNFDMEHFHAMQATLANYRWISEIIFQSRGPAVRRLTHTEIKQLQEMLRVLPTQLLMMNNTSNFKRKSSILLHVKRRASTRQSFPTKKNGKRNMPGSLVRILVMVCFVRHA